MKILLTIALTLFISLIVYMLIPFSPVKSSFKKKVSSLIDEKEVTEDTITRDTLSSFPPILQAHFIRRGFLQKKTTSMIKIEFKDVDFSLKEDKPPLKMDYTLYDFKENTTRLALIDTALFGIPFQGSEGFVDGSGWMKGVIGKHFTLFNERGDNMDSAALLTFLAESLIHPSLMLSENIVLYEHDKNSVRATITNGDIQAEGIFYFYDDNNKVEFHTLRYNSDTSSKEKWISIMGNFKDNNGVLMPSVFQGLWRYDDRDFLYFNGDDITVN